MAVFEGRVMGATRLSTALPFIWSCVPDTRQKEEEFSCPGGPHLPAPRSCRGARELAPPPFACGLCLPSSKSAGEGTEDWEAAAHQAGGPLVGPMVRGQLGEAFIKRGQELCP